MKHVFRLSMLSLVVYTICIPLTFQANSAAAQEKGRDGIVLNDKEPVSPQVLITSPQQGTFSTEPTIVVAGHIVAADFASVRLTLNNAPVAIEQDGTFSADIALDHSSIFNPILAELSVHNSAMVRSRIVVINGNAMADGELVPDTLGLRINVSGFDRIESLLENRVNVDPLKLLPGGSIINDEICDKIPPFGVEVCGEVKVSISQSRPPRFQSYDIDLDSQRNVVTAAVNIHDIFVSADVEASAGPLSLSCQIDVNAGTVLVAGAFQLEPKASQPATINVTQQGDMMVSFGNFSDDTDCNGFIGDVIEELVDQFTSDIQTRLRNSLADSLNAVNNAGNTPVAEALEVVLADVSIERLIHDLAAEEGLLVEAPLAQVAEDVAGITLSANTLITPVTDMQSGKCDKPSETLRQLATYHLPATFPTFGAKTPAPNSLSYDIGFSVSVTGVNQLLKAATECGLLHMDFKEIDVVFESGPINAGLLSLFIPAFGSLDPDLPLTVMIRPTLAPLITGDTGPGGELIDLRISHLLVGVIGPSGSVLLQLALDVQMGLNLTLDTPTQALQLSVGEIANLNLEMLDNAVGADLANLQLIAEQLLPLVSSFYDALEPFTLPTMFGEPLEPVDIISQDGYFSLYMKLAS